jgi:hypothetical protein
MKARTILVTTVIPTLSGWEVKTEATYDTDLSPNKPLILEIIMSEDKPGCKFYSYEGTKLGSITALSKQAVLAQLRSQLALTQSLLDNNQI